MSNIKHFYGSRKKEIQSLLRSRLLKRDSARRHRVAAERHLALAARVTAEAVLIDSQIAELERLSCSKVVAKSIKTMNIQED